MCTKFDVSSFTRSNIREGSQNLKIRPKTPPHGTHPLLGLFIVIYDGKYQDYQTKFEVSSFTRSEFREGSQNLKNSAHGPHHAPFGGILASVR